MMRYQLLGRSGLRVSELCLGTMTFGAGEWGTSESDASAIYSCFREAGGNFFDTANEIYAEGRSEEILGRLVSGHRDEVVIATKYSLALPGARDVNRAGNHRKSLMRSLERSLKRLGTDHVDMMWIHAWDGITPIDEIMRALDDAVSIGKLLYLGASNVPAWVVAQGNTLADCRGLTSFAGLQVEYSLIQRSAEYELFPMARALDLGVMAWSPLASGILSGKYGRAAPNEPHRLDTLKLRSLDERSNSLATAVVTVGERIGHSAAQVALNWVRGKGCIMPIIGARTLAQLEDNLGCLGFELDAQTMAQLDEQSLPPRVYPHDYLQFVQPLVHGGFQGALELDRSHRL
ncbi:aldo/keto reductase [Burkholderia sp. H160]|nr:aldo/keto reductase [Burkholderia sp. H160]